MKISDLAMLPHQSRSASTAMIRPKAVDKNGDDQQPAEIVERRLPEACIAEGPGVIGKADEVLAELVEQAQAQRLEHRIDQIDRQKQQRRENEEPRAHRGARMSRRVI